MARSCVFCGVRPGNTKEDAWPVWLMSFLHPNRTPYAHVHAGRWHSPQVTRQWRGKQFRVGGYCETCNNGWMSRLEAEAKPFLTQMIRDESFAFSKKSQKAVARWVYLKTLVFSTATEMRVPPDAFSIFFKTKKPPPLSRVWACRYEENVDGALFFWREFAPQEGQPPHNYRTVFVFGHLVLSFLRYKFTADKLTPRPQKGSFLPMFLPLPSDEVEWPLGASFTPRLLDMYLDMDQYQDPSLYDPRVRPLDRAFKRL